MGLRGFLFYFSPSLPLRLSKGFVGALVTPDSVSLFVRLRGDDDTDGLAVHHYVRVYRGASAFDG